MQVNGRISALIEWERVSSRPDRRETSFLTGQFWDEEREVKRKWTRLSIFREFPLPHPKNILPEYASSFYCYVNRNLAGRRVLRLGLRSGAVSKIMISSKRNHCFVPQHGIGLSLCGRAILLVREGIVKEPSGHRGYYRAGGAWSRSS
jgi:hypothetical protein